MLVHRIQRYMSFNKEHNNIKICVSLTKSPLVPATTGWDYKSYNVTRQMKTHSYKGWMKINPASVRGS